jgi:hypothetical protein
VNKKQFLNSLLTLAGCLLMVGTLIAAPVPSTGLPGLKEVPATTPLLIHVKGIKGTAHRIVNLLKQVSDQAEVAKFFIENFIENGQDGRKLRGLDEDGPIFVAFSELPESPDDLLTKGALILKVTNYAEFRNNVLKEDERKNLKKNEAGYESIALEDGKSIYFLDRKDYAVVTMSKDLALSYTKKPAGLDEKISKELGTKLLSSDIGVYVNMSPFNKQYAEQIKEARKAIDDFLKSGVDDNKKNLKQQMESIAKAMPAIFQAVEDSQGLLASFEFRSKGLAFHVQTEVRAGSKTNDLFKDGGVTPFKDVEGLPAGLMVYSAVKTSPTLLKIGGAMMLGALGDLDSPENKAIKTAFDNMLKAKPSTFVSGANLPPEGVTVWNFADPKKALENQIALIKDLGAGGTYLSAMLKKKPEIKAKAEQYEGIDFTSVKLEWDLEKMAEEAGADVPEAQKKAMGTMMEKLVGPGSTIWYGADDKRFFQITAKDWPTAKKLLDTYLKEKSPIGAEGNFKDVRKELPAETSILGMMDLVKYATAIVSAMKPLVESLVPLPANYPPAFQGKPSFIGVAISMEKNHGSFDLYISAMAVRDVYTNFVVPLLPK